MATKEKSGFNRFNPNITLFLLLVFSISISFSQSFTQVLVSNATYGGTIYVLAYNEKGPLAGEVHAVSPTNMVTSAQLSAGQASFAANETGVWDIYFSGQMYRSYVSDSASGQFPQPSKQPSGDFLALAFGSALSFPVFMFFLGLFLAAAIVFLYFFLTAYSPHRFEVKKKVEKGIVAVTIKNHGPNARKVLMLDFYEEGKNTLCVQKQIGNIKSGKSVALSYPAGKNSRKYPARAMLLSEEKVDEA